MLVKKNKGSLLVKLGVVLVVLAAVGFVVFRNLQVTARVKAAERGNAVDAVTGSVTVSADGGIVALPSEAAGKVIATNIEPGSSFKKGDLLVQLDTAEIERQISEAERKYKDDKARAKMVLESNPEKIIATEKLETARRLNTLNVVSADDVKSAERALEAIEARLRLTEFDTKKGDVDYKVAMDDALLRKEKMSVRAPFDGTVDGALTWEGALISSGQPVAMIFKRQRVVAAKISEEKFGRVKVGQTARLRLLTYGTQEYEAKVSKLLPTADDAQRFTVYLDVKVDDIEQLKPNSTGEVTITVDQRSNQVMIPRRALFDSNKVFVVTNGRVQKREVDVGFVALNVTEIRKGVEPGELVVVDTLEAFRDGQSVRVEVIK